MNRNFLTGLCTLLLCIYTLPCFASGHLVGGVDVVTVLLRFIFLAFTFVVNIICIVRAARQRKIKTLTLLWMSLVFNVLWLFYFCSFFIREVAFSYRGTKSEFGVEIIMILMLIMIIVDVRLIIRFRTGKA